VIDAALVAQRLHEVRERLVQSGNGHVAVMAVTKTWPLEAVHAAVAAGCEAVGENYAQEMSAKFRGVSVSCPRAFIGRLQTNKVRVIRDVVDVIETVDRDSLVDEIARLLPGLPVLIQVNTEGDDHKGGCPPDQVDRLVQRARDSGLQVHGLMTVGPTEGGAHAAQAGFRAVRAMVDRLGLSVCSMGMSDDYQIAAAEGATQVRLGSALFGPRPRG
jgi:PLP dependent protein